MRLPLAYGIPTVWMALLLFLNKPTATQGISVEPSFITTTPGSQVVFTCEYTGSAAPNWTRSPGNPNMIYPGTGAITSSFFYPEPVRSPAVLIIKADEGQDGSRYRCSGMAGQSNEASLTVAAKPSCVTNVKVRELGFTSITVQWTLVSSPIPVTYVLQISPLPISGVKIWETQEEPFRFANLQLSTNHSIAIRARNSVGASELCPSSTITARTRDSHFIYHPVNISAAVGRIVSFSCGFVGISPPNWIVTGMPDNSFTVSPSGTVGNYYYPFPHDGNATLQTITGVTEDADGVCATCVIAVVGGTFYSETGCLSIAGPPACVREIEVPSTNTTSFTANWDRPESLIPVNYTVCICPESVEDLELNCSKIDVTDSSVTVNGLSAGSKYNITVSVQNDAGQAQNCTENSALAETNKTFASAGNTEGLVAVLLGTSIPVTFTITVPVTVILTFVVFYLVFKSRKKCISGGSEEDQEQKKQEPTYSTNIESQVEVEMQACPAYDTFLTAEKENTAEYV